MRAFAGFALILILLAASPAPGAEPRPRSILVLDQSDPTGPLFREIFTGFLAVLRADPTAHTVYSESLDFSRFTSRDYEDSLQEHLRTKYRDKSIGVVVVIGAKTLEYVLSRRAALWPDTPIVFAQVDEATVAKLKPPPDVTGIVMKFRLSDMVISARAVVPGLRRVAFVGDAWETQTAYRHWRDDIPLAVGSLEVLDLTGLPMWELRKRVADLPDHTAIIYSAIYSDGEGTFYPPVRALELFSETANRPIVVSVETFLGHGGVGGFVMIPSLIGEAAARIVLRIMGGEEPARISVSDGNVVRPVFDWRQLVRWGVSESDLPQGSEIRFRDPTLWSDYRWAIIAIGAVILLQAGLITGLLYEHRRRRVAEVEARRRPAELALVNRRATAGELSASIAHEINQPLSAILANAETAEAILGSSSPRLDEIKEILADIRRDDERATEIIRRLRRMLTKEGGEAQIFDINETVREVMKFLSVPASAAKTTLTDVLGSRPLLVRGDRIQLQQVVLNLVVNGMEATAEAANSERKITARAAPVNDASVEVSIADSGHGIPPDTLKRVFQPFFTTKEHGMGMGLSIASTIIEAHEGRIWAENQAGGGAVFRFRLPLAKASPG